MNSLTKHCHRGWLAIALCGLVACATSHSIGQDTPTAAAFEPKPIQGSLIDFLTGMPVSYQLQLLQTDPLLRPPFAGAPLDSAKGLAAKIKGQQLDAKNRIKALKFLGDVDCVEYPESQQVLVKHLREDPVEKVRLAAAKALEEQLSHGKDEKPNRRERRRKDTCKGCCTKMVLNALSECAYETDDQGCYLEPSKRVREAAEDALKTCCDCWGEPSYEANTAPEVDAAPEAQPDAPKTDKTVPPAPAVPSESDAKKSNSAAAEIRQPQLLPEPVSAPVASDPIEAAPIEAAPIEAAPIEASEEVQADPASNITEVEYDGAVEINEPAPAQPALEVVETESVEDAPILDAPLPPSNIPEAEPFEDSEPVLEPEADPQPAVDVKPAQPKPVTMQSVLKDRCIVSIIEGQPTASLKKYASVYQGHRYQFSSLRAKHEFDACPVKYAPMMAGADPVHFRLTGEIKIGSNLVRHNGRTYLFLTESNAAAFVSDLAVAVDEK